MSDDTCRTRRSCRCSRWPDYVNRFGWPVRGEEQYYQKVLSYGPIAYWPLWESAGVTAHCLVNALQDGTYNSPVGGWPPGEGIGDGHTAPYFDGTNDVVNVLTATFSAAFDGAEGSAALWFRVANVGVWTDGAVRRALQIEVDGNNFNSVAYKDFANNQMLNYRRGGGVTETNVWNPYSSIAWVHAAMTWSEAADEVRYYRDGAWLQTRTVLGAWAGALALAAIGAGSLVPAQAWQGWLAHVVIADRPWTAPEIADLATV